MHHNCVIKMSFSWDKYRIYLPKKHWNSNNKRKTKLDSQDKKIIYPRPFYHPCCMITLLINPPFFFFDSTLLLQLFFFPTCLRPPLERVNYPLCGLCPLRQVLSFPHWHQGAPVRPGICDERGHAQVLSEGGVVQAFLLCPLLLLLSLLVSIRHIVRNTIRLHVK